MTCPTTTWCALGWTASEWATIAGAVGAALVAAVVAVAGYFIQQRRTRSERRDAVYAEALRAVEDYLEAPYLIRRHDGTDGTRQELVRRLSNVQSRIAYYCALLRLHASRRVSEAYDAYVAAARHEAGVQMTEAWKTRPTRRDRDVPLGVGYARTESAKARAMVVAAMRRRWWRRNR